MNDQRAQPSRPTFARTLEVFRYRPFLLFWIGACVSNTGNWTENAAQSWAVTSQTVGNPHQGFHVDLLQCADFCPVLVLALLAGVISDRANRKTWLLILQAAAGVLGAGLAVAAFLGRATPASPLPRPLDFRQKSEGSRRFRRFPQIGRGKAARSLIPPHFNLRKSAKSAAPSASPDGTFAGGLVFPRAEAVGPE